MSLHSNKFNQFISRPNFINHTHAAALKGIEVFLSDSIYFIFMLTNLCTRLKLLLNNSKLSLINYYAHQCYVFALRCTQIEENFSPQKLIHSGKCTNHFWKNLPRHLPVMFIESLSSSIYLNLLGGILAKVPRQTGLTLDTCRSHDAIRMSLSSQGRKENELKVGRTMVGEKRIADSPGDKRRRWWWNRTESI